MLLDEKINWKDTCTYVPVKLKLQKNVYCFFQESFLIKALLKAYTLCIPIHRYISYLNIDWASKNMLFNEAYLSNARPLIRSLNPFVSGKFASSFKFQVQTQKQ